MITTNVGYENAPTAEIERDKYVISELKRLVSIAEQQEKLVVELVSRLSPVSLSEQSSASEAKDFPATGVPLADDIASVTKKLECINETIEALVSRLEI